MNAYHLHSRSLAGITLLISLTVSTITVAESIRIEVYPQGQSYYDVNPGDSLSSIVRKLLPEQPSKHKHLMEQLVSLNPQAFVNNNPDQLKANTRLWFSSHYRPGNIKDPDKYIIKDFSWGQSYKPRR